MTLKQTTITVTSCIFCAKISILFVFQRRTLNYIATVSLFVVQGWKKYRRSKPQNVKICRNMQVMRFPRNLEVWKLGTVGYAEALKLQEKLVSERKASKIADSLLSLQHPPTYTLGKRRTDHNLLISETNLKKIGAELHYTQRGGDITFHGPHQAILYPIISLRDIGLGARSYVEKLELTMIELASLYKVKANPGQKDETGVWVEDRKIGAIGVKISNGITSHGLAFNIDPDMNYYKHIVPCGIADKEVTSLRRESGLNLPHDGILQDQLIACFMRLFGYDNVVWKENASIESRD